MADLSIDQLMEIHLSHIEFSFTKDFVVHSSLNSLEMNMIHSKALKKSNPFAPILCAFAILDQLGTTYKIKNNHCRLTNGIKRSITLFYEEPISMDQINSLVSFRNGAVHNGSFSNYDKYNKIHSMFRFNNNIDSIIKLPDRPWDGSGDDFEEDVCTYINKDMFIKLTIDILSKVRDLFQKNNIYTELDNESFIHRFILWADKDQFLKKNSI
ncbi:hypothetical protein [Acetobacter syzygii]|uniref:hypothetical protein n=1 Tax=Acetobacter syzygii TaxID=146476 RepID=UPI0039E9B709